MNVKLFCLLVVLFLCCTSSLSYPSDILSKDSSAKRWMFSSHTIVPFNRIDSVLASKENIRQYQVSSLSFILPPWQAKRMRFAYQNAYTSPSGKIPAELLPPTHVMINAALFRGNSLLATLTFDGKPSLTLSSGAIKWSDPVVVPEKGNEPLYIRTYSELPLDGQRLGRRRAAVNEKDSQTYVFETKDKDKALALLTSGIMQNNAGSAHAFGPVAQVADGWDGRPVVLVVGDSIAAGHDNSLGLSWITDALISPVGGVMGYYNMAIHGTRPSGQIGDDQYGMKAGIVDSLVEMNHGELPMTVILSEMGVNDAGGNDGKRLQDKMQHWFDYLHKKWPKAKLLQTTFTPRTKGGVGLKTGTVLQPAVSLSPIAADRWFVADWIKTKPSPLNGFIDVRAAWTGSDVGVNWYAIPWQSSLLEDASEGGTEIVINKCPPDRISLVLSQQGLPESEIVKVVSWRALAERACRVSLSHSIKKRYATDASVDAIMSMDGLHPDDGFASKRAQSVVEQAKKAGLFD